MRTSANQRCVLRPWSWWQDGKRDNGSAPISMFDFRYVATAIIISWRRWSTLCACTSCVPLVNYIN